MEAHIDSSLSREDLASIDCNLNCWQWDERLGSKPDGWDEMLDYRFNELSKETTKSDIIRPYREVIENKIGEKACLKYWNVNKYKTMTNIEFEIHWIKRMFKKFFGIGFYSKKNKKLIVDVLTKITEKERADWVSENYLVRKYKRHIL